MVMKRPGVLELYRGGAAPLPSGDMDARILAAARAARPRPARFALLAATGLVAAMALMIVVRWYAPGDSPPAEVAITNYGTEEGQAWFWLSSFQPAVTATGSGSQEGIS